MENRKNIFAHVIKQQECQKRLIYYEKLPLLFYKQISRRFWPNLKQIRLWQSNLSDEGCLYLTIAKIPNLTSLELWKCRLTDIGWFYISQAEWPMLTKLVLALNRFNTARQKLTSRICKYISRGRWPQLFKLQMSISNVDSDGVSQLLSADWPKLKQLSLCHNDIGDVGCKNLVDSAVRQKLCFSVKECLGLTNNRRGTYWRNLSSINLQNNRISNLGCLYLIRVEQPLLVNLYLNGNQIGDEGCEILTRSQWNKLQKIQLLFNALTKNGVLSFKRKSWKNIRQFNVSFEEQDLENEGDIYRHNMNTASLMCMWWNFIVQSKNIWDTIIYQFKVRTQNQH